MGQQSDTRPRGRPRTNWTQIGVKAPPTLLAQLDAWRLAQPDAPTRPAAIRRLLAAALLQQTTPPPSTQQPRFADGDRVHSEKFGAGVVRGPARPAAASQLFADPADEGTQKWIVSVAWDDRTWGIIETAEDALEPMNQGSGS